MSKERTVLPKGTTVAFSDNSIYRICGASIGAGGGSLIYPAERLIHREGQLCPDGLRYALKECFPVCEDFTFLRDPATGAIYPEQQESREAEDYQRQVREGLQNEVNIGRQIFRSASRMIPIREATERAVLTLPGGSPNRVENVYVAMDSLEEKGRSLQSYIEEYRRIDPLTVFRILQSLLFAVREVHDAGFLHMDLQDGNVFLRGSLNESEWVTLIDFGSAIPVERPAKGYSLFSTRAFAAPELRRYAEPGFCLTPAADLYAVGCLGYYLMTGAYPDPLRILAVNNGLYLKPNQLRRLHYPKHLESRIQSVLAKALAADPAERYQSCDEMLGELEPLLAMLQPQRTQLECVEYDAFISYKHGRDSDTARMLQKNLESLRVPRAVSGRRQPFSRVFVDEGELSSCADLGKAIETALKNSEWLIVICSKDKSPWIDEEIAVFLKYHDRSHILALLTDGEPKEAFPETLKGDAAGNGAVLAADIRGAKNKREKDRLLRGEALLKLAAPMLGVPYDSLVQRQKVRRMKILMGAAMLVLALSIGFAAFAINRARIISGQKQQIAEELYHTQVKESLFLSSQAERRLAAQDPYGAVELALQALPSDTNDRPYVAEADYVLRKALGLYGTMAEKENKPQLLGKIPVAQNAGIFVTPDDRFILIYDADGIAFYDAVTLEQTGSLNAEQLGIEDPAYLYWSHFTNDRESLYDTETTVVYLIPDSFTIVAYDLAKGEILWTQKLEEGIDTAALFPDRKQLLIVNGSSWLEEYYTTILDNGTGRIVTSFALPLEQEEPDTEDSVTITASPAMLRIAPDGSSFAVSSGYIVSSVPEYLEETVFVFSTDGGELLQSVETGMDVVAVSYAEDNTLYVTAVSDFHAQVTLYNRTAEYIWPGNIVITAVAPETGETLWSCRAEADGMTSGMEKNSEVILSEYEDGGTEKNIVCVICGNRALILDRGNGSILRSFGLTAAMVDYVYYPGGGVVVYTEDGKRNTVPFNLNYSGTEQYLDPELTDLFVTAKDSRYYEKCENGDALYIYGLDAERPGYTQVYRFERSSFLYPLYGNVTETDYAVFRGDDRLVLVDLHTKGRKEVEMNTNGLFDARFLGHTENRELLLRKSERYGEEYLLIDFESGSVTTVENPPELVNNPADDLLQHAAVSETDHKYTEWSVEVREEDASAVVSRNGERLYLLADDGTLSEYGTSGVLLGQLDLEAYAGQKLSLQYRAYDPEWLVIDETTVALWTERGMFVLYDGDTSLKVLFFLVDGAAFDREGNRFLAVNGEQIAAYANLSVSEVTALGRELF